MSNYRQNAFADEPHKPLPWTWGTLPVSLLMVFVIVVLMGLATEADLRDDAQLRTLAVAEKQRLAMPTQLRDAYEAGMVDALAATRDTPDGVALAQACLGMPARSGVSK